MFERGVLATYAQLVERARHNIELIGARVRSATVMLRRAICTGKNPMQRF
jgi:hypothetical protein